MPGTRPGMTTKQSVHALSGVIPEIASAIIRDPGTPVPSIVGWLPDPNFLACYAGRESTIRRAVLPASPVIHRAADDRVCELIRVERLQVVDALADADRVDRQLVPGRDRNQDAAARGAVQFRHHDT